MTQPTAPTPVASWKPTRKWMVATIAALGTLAVMGLSTGVGTEFQIALVGLIVQRATAYLIPNEDESAPEA